MVLLFSSGMKLSYRSRYLPQWVFRICHVFLHMSGPERADLGRLQLGIREMTWWGLWFVSFNFWSSFPYGGRRYGTQNLSAESVWMNDSMVQESKYPIAEVTACKEVRGERVTVRCRSVFACWERYLSSAASFQYGAGVTNSRVCRRGRTCNAWKKFATSMLKLTLTINLTVSSVSRCLFMRGHKHWDRKCGRSMQIPGA